MKIAGRRKTTSDAPNGASVAAGGVAADSAAAAAAAAVADVAIDDTVGLGANGNENMSGGADMAVDNGNGSDLPVGVGIKDKGKAVKEPSAEDEDEEEDEEEVEEGDVKGEEGEYAMVEGRPGPVAGDPEMFPVQAIRRRRKKGGKVEYMVKWLGWPEAANTWEPPENLASVPDIVEAFERRRGSGKPRKRKSNSSADNTQPKKRQERSITPYSLRRFTNSTSDTHAQSAALNDLNLADPRAFPRPVIFADEQENNGDVSSLGKAKFSNGSSSTIPPETPQINAENEYDPKLSELKAATTNGHGADKLALQSQEGNVTTDGDQMDGRSKGVSVEQGRNLRSKGGKKLKYGSAKKTKKDSRAGEPVTAEKLISRSAGEFEPVRPGNAVHVGNNTQRKKPMYDIISIIRPLGFSPTVSGNDVVVSFMALRSDGMEVLVDNAFLKKHHPALLIQFYEQHIRYNACSD